MRKSKQTREQDDLQYTAFYQSMLLGREAAMACTVAVEATITEHYNDQIRALVAIKDELSEEEREILDVITKCRDDEQEHHDTGLEQEAEKAIAYPVLSSAITAGCKAAIWVSERVQSKIWFNKETLM